MTHVDVQTQRRGPRDTAKWRFRALLVLSGILHVVFTPWAGLWGLARFLPEFGATPLPEDPINAIPVDLVADRPAPSPVSPPPAEPVPSPAEQQPTSEPDAPKAPPPETAKKEPEPPKPEPAEAPEEAPPDDQSFGDPVALSGAAGKIADPNANVRLLLYTERIREHPLGTKVGRMLTATPQWRDFFGPAQVDPVRDIDRVLIAGPQLRDSSNVVAVVQHGLPPERMETGLAQLVARGGGEWLEGKMKVARTRADRAQRLIALPGPQLVAVVPPSAEKSLQTLSKQTRFAEGPPGVVLQAYLVTPARIFIGAPISLPASLDTIKWARLDLRPRPDGGVVVRLVAEDASPEAAARNAREIERTIRSANSLGSFVFGKGPMLERVVVRSEDEQIQGTLELSLDQIGLLLDLAAKFMPSSSSSPSPSPGIEPPKDQPAMARPFSTSAPSAPDPDESSAPPSSGSPAAAPLEPPAPEEPPAPAPDPGPARQNDGLAADE